MLDYPYPTNYGIPLPGWPVNVSCAALASTSDPILGMALVADVFYNSSGQHSCYALDDGPDWGTCCGWNYLYCTEVYQPYAQGGIFPPSAWDLNVRSSLATPLTQPPRPTSSSASSSLASSWTRAGRRRTGAA